MTGQIVEAVLVTQEARCGSCASELVVVGARGTLDRNSRTSNAVIALGAGLTEMQCDVGRVGAVRASIAQVARLARLAVRRVDGGVGAGRTQAAAVSLEESRVIYYVAASRAEDTSLRARRTVCPALAANGRLGTSRTFVVVGTLLLLIECVVVAVITARNGHISLRSFLAIGSRVTNERLIGSLGTVESSRARPAVKLLLGASRVVIRACRARDRFGSGCRAVVAARAWVVSVVGRTFILTLITLLAWQTLTDDGLGSLVVVGGLWTRHLSVRVKRAIITSRAHCVTLTNNL